MDAVKLGTSDVMSSRIVYGCMRIVGDDSKDARENGKQTVRGAIEEGYTHFDHADIHPSPNRRSSHRSRPNLNP